MRNIWMPERVGLESRSKVKRVRRTGAAWRRSKQESGASQMETGAKGEAGEMGVAGSDGGVRVGSVASSACLLPRALATNLCWRTEEMLPKALPPSCHRL